MSGKTGKSVTEQKIDSRYKNLEKLGEGTYGVVYKAIDTETDEVLAVKKIRLEDEDQGVPSTTLREIAVLKELNHPSVVKLKNVSYIPKSKKLYLFFEYVEMDLKKYMYSIGKEPINPKLVKIFMKQLIEGVLYCHSRRVIHRDLKPQNILIGAKEGLLKIADFGLCRCFTVPINTLTHEILTLWYRSPEILLGQKAYGLGVDTWSIGCIFAEMLTAKVLFKGNSEIEQLFLIFKFWGTPTEEEWPGISQLPYYRKTFPHFKAPKEEKELDNIDPLAKDLILKFITLDPKARISCIDALKHPYFNENK